MQSQYQPDSELRKLPDSKAREWQQQISGVLQVQVIIQQLLDLI